MPHARILIRPKADVLDPQGTAVEEALPHLGLRGMTNVRVGRLVELEAEDPAQLEAACQKLLANPLIEDYEILLGASAEQEQAPSADEVSGTGALGGAV